MGTWWIGSKEEQNYAQLMDAMRAMKIGDTIECDDLGKEQYIAYLKAGGRWNDEICGIHPIPNIFLDGGGSVSGDEPTVSWESNGAKLKTYVRHLPFVLEAFQGLKPYKKLPDLYVIGGFCRSYLLALKTVHDSIEVMDRLVKGTESLRQELEQNTQKLYNEMTHGFSARKCGCMSGKIYVECCGKFIESPKHKETREAAEDR